MTLAGMSQIQWPAAAVEHGHSQSFPGSTLDEASSRHPLRFLQPVSHPPDPFPPWASLPVTGVQISPTSASAPWMTHRTQGRQEHLTDGLGLPPWLTAGTLRAPGRIRGSGANPVTLSGLDNGGEPHGMCLESWVAIPYPSCKGLDGLRGRIEPKPEATVMGLVTAQLRLGTHLPLWPPKHGCERLAPKGSPPGTSRSVM